MEALESPPLWPIKWTPWPFWSKRRRRHKFWNTGNWTTPKNSIEFLVVVVGKALAFQKHLIYTVVGRKTYKASYRWKSWSQKKSHDGGSWLDYVVRWHSEEKERNRRGQKGLRYNTGDVVLYCENRYMTFSFEVVGDGFSSSPLHHRSGVSHPDDKKKTYGVRDAFPPPQKKVLR